jgi:hypothetical protein
MKSSTMVMILQIVDLASLSTLPLLLYLKKSIVLVLVGRLHGLGIVRQEMQQYLGAHLLTYLVQILEV